MQTPTSFLNRKKSLAERKDDLASARYELEAAEASLAYDTKDQRRIDRHVAAQAAVTKARNALSAQ